MLCLAAILIGLPLPAPAAGLHWIASREGQTEGSRCPHGQRTPFLEHFLDAQTAAHRQPYCFGRTKVLKVQNILTSFDRYFWPTQYIYIWCKFDLKIFAAANFFVWDFASFFCLWLGIFYSDSRKSKVKCGVRIADFSWFCEPSLCLLFLY